MSKSSADLYRRAPPSRRCAPAGPLVRPDLRATAPYSTAVAAATRLQRSAADPALPSLIAAYLLIRRADEAAAAASATVAAT